jgi:hypothetical protein
MQECRPPSPQDAGMILLSMGMGYLFICLKSPDPTLQMENKHVERKKWKVRYSQL